MWRMSWRDCCGSAWWPIPSRALSISRRGRSRRSELSWNAPPGCWVSLLIGSALERCQPGPARCRTIRSVSVACARSVAGCPRRCPRKGCAGRWRPTERGGRHGYSTSASIPGRAASGGPYRLADWGRDSAPLLRPGIRLSRGPGRPGPAFRSRTGRGFVAAPLRPRALVEGTPAGSNAAEESFRSVPLLLAVAGILPLRQHRLARPAGDAAAPSGWRAPAVVLTGRFGAVGVYRAGLLYDRRLSRRPPPPARDSRCGGRQSRAGGVHLDPGG